MNDKKTLELIKKGHQAYEKIRGKELHYVYLKNNAYYELVFKPQKQQFLHLCGLKYINPKTKSPYSANQFYDFVKSNRINLNSIVKDSMSDQKLMVLAQLNDLLTSHAKVIDSKTSFLRFTFYKAIRSRKRIFCLALVAENSKELDIYVPLSMLNLSTNPKGSSVPSGHFVHCVYLVEDKTRKVEFLNKSTDFIEFENNNVYPYEGVLEVLDAYPSSMTLKLENNDSIAQLESNLAK